MNTEWSDFGRTKVLSPTQNYVKTEQNNYFKYKKMFHIVNELSSGAVRSIFNILYNFHEPAELHPCCYSHPTTKALIIKRLNTRSTAEMANTFNVSQLRTKD